MSGVFPDQEHVETLKKSQEILERFGINAIYEVIVDDTTGKVLAGSHRKSADKNWPEKHITTKTELQRQLIILHSNCQRIPKREETRYRLIQVAKCLEKEGVPKRQIAMKVAELVPYTENYVRELLPAEYKEDQQSQAAKKMHETRHEPKPVSEAGQKQPEESQESPDVDKIAEAFMPKDRAPIVLYPFENCQCKGCEHENNCPKLFG